MLGGGLIGLACAFELARRGADVHLYERDRIGAQSSWAGAGMLAPFTEGIENAAFLAFLEDSLERYRDFCEAIAAESGILQDVSTRGIVDIAFTQSDSQRLYLRSDRLKKKSRRFSHLDARELRELEPVISGDAREALLTHEEGYVDNRLLVRGLHLACLRTGVSIHEGAGVLALSANQRRVTGFTTERGFVGAATVVNALGAWAGSLAGVPEPARVPVRPVRGQMLMLQLPSGFIHHVMWGNGVYLVPRSDGRLLVGATVEDAGFDASTTAAGIAWLLRSALDLAPALREFPILEMWAGLRPGTPDELPFISETSLDGYFVACGHYRNGILLAPATAQLVADLVESKPNPHAEAFSERRVKIVV